MTVPPLRLTRGDPLLVASHNQGKVAEIAALLAPFSIEVTAAAALGLPEPEETAFTFEGNATLKALAAAKASGRVALADDSGFKVDALGGAPGVYAASWAGPQRDFSLAMTRVAHALALRAAKPPYPARFISVLCLAHPDGRSATFRGEVEGEAQFPPRGAQGFGYDPIFVPQGETRTFAEMAPPEKERLSHRNRAFEALVEACFAP